MRIALTGATGFIGRYVARHLIGAGHTCRAWYRANSDRSGFGDLSPGIDWVPGELGSRESCRELVAGCQAVVHAALYHPGGGFRGGEGDLIEFVERNVVGSLKLIEAARAAGVPRFVQFSTCAVHEKILDDRPLDETHPTWPATHYGAHKAALEQFVHSFGLGAGYAICALRPSGVYGINHPIDHSKWYQLVSNVVAGRDVDCAGGGKEVHAADVAQAVGLLLTAPDAAIAGQAFNCCDRYVSQWEVATLARQFAQSNSEIRGQSGVPKHQIATGKLRGLGLQFGGRVLLERTVREMVQRIAGE
jgi:nucleoside-diphosphate-sugar epimerase